MAIKKKILFLGASITQGKISISYVKMLKEKLGTANYEYINHAVAGYEAYNVLAKLGKAVELKPDFVILLVGTNDVTSSLDPVLAVRTRKWKHIPHEPTLENYSNNITAIIRQLKQETTTIIAVASLPVIGENLESAENKALDQYNAALKQIADHENVCYVPINERQKAFLIERNGGLGKEAAQITKMAFQSLLRHYFLFESLDRISRRNGFLLLTDGIHQNTLGAQQIADEILKNISFK
jgi:lysophospholipase L1-like esterase